MEFSTEITEHLIQHSFITEYPDENGNPAYRVYKNGLRGGHDMDEFFKALAETGISQKELIISCTPHPKINGIYSVKYRMPVYDSGAIVRLCEIQEPKTLYDPRLISLQQIYQWMREALQNGKVTTTPGGQYKFKGYAKNGLCFHGYIENGEFESIFPTMALEQPKILKFFEKLISKSGKK